jgi:hypothetical protein
VVYRPVLAGEPEKFLATPRGLARGDMINAGIVSVSVKDNDIADAFMMMYYIHVRATDIYKAAVSGGLRTKNSNDIITRFIEMQVGKQETVIDASLEEKFKKYIL